MVLAQLGEFERAIESLENCTTLNNRDEETYYYLGVCYYSIDDYNLGIKYLTKAIELRGNYLDAINLRANIFYEQNKFEMAIDDYVLSLSIVENFDLYYSVASCYDKLNMLNEAFEIYSFLLDKEITNKDAVYYNMGNIKNANGKYIEAVDYFKSAISINKNVPLYYYNLGISYYFIDEIDLALSNWCTAKKMGFKNFEDSILQVINDSGFSSKFTNCD